MDKQSIGSFVYKTGLLRLNFLVNTCLMVQLINSHGKKQHSRRFGGGTGDFADRVPDQQKQKGPEENGAGNYQIGNRSRETR